MLHPVLPPTPPPIVQTLQPATLTSDASQSQQVGCASCALADTRLVATSEKMENSPHPSTPAQKELSLTKTPSPLSEPEAFPAEFSPFPTAKKAALLGKGLRVGYPLQNLETPYSDDGGSTNAVTVSSSTIEQPIKIEFNTQSQTNQPSIPSTIEFKSRSQLNQLPLPSTTTPEPSVPEPEIPTTTGEESQPSVPEPEIPTTTGEESQPSVPEPEIPTTTGEESQPSVPEPEIPTTTGEESQPSEMTPPANTPPETRRVIEVIADRQEYDEQRRIITAEGNVEVRFDGAVVNAERLQVSLENLIAVGSGDIALVRGEQILRGERFTYNFIQDSGEILDGSGDVFIPTSGQDLSFSPTTAGTGGVTARPISERIRANQPLQASSPGEIIINLGGTRGVRNIPTPRQGGEINRLRFEAERIDFYPRGWVAREARITNDPFSPPELEVRADTITFTQETPFRDRIKTEGQRLVFDQGFSLPIPKDEEVIDRREREVTPGLFSIGYDGDERGGVFIERTFKPIDRDELVWSITPQFLVQKTIQGSESFPSQFGLKTRLNAILGPQTIVDSSAVFTSLNLSDVEDNLRASVRLRQALGQTNPHILALEYSYRDRLYNGTLGFQTVQSSLGGVVTSPIIPLGNSGFNLTYQAGAQYINARTDREDLLEDDRDNDRVSLSRLQASARVGGGFFLWQGKPLAPTATEGLRYTGNPVVPFLRVNADLTGTSNYYTSGDNQSTLIGTIGLEGQFGHFSRPWLDYTAFNVSYSQGIFSGESPFFFDRAVDSQVLSLGFVQQLYGPFRFGFQTSFNLQTSERSSTDYILEYSRRTYGITLRYNPVLELGGISFRISDFNWTGGTDPFSDPSEIKPVRGGVEQYDY
jgi:hypothetical protein